MKAAIIQSSYIPWKGYFDIIHDAELFIFHDNIQYTRRDWRNRNYIKKISGGLHCLTVPVVKAPTDTRIDRIQISGHEWQKKHLGSIESNYAHAPFFKEVKPLMEDFYLGRQWKYISEMNQYMVRKISAFLGIRTRFQDASDMSVEGKKTERLIHILKSVGATEYVSGPAGHNYIEAGLFEKAGIRLTYKSYSDYPTYRQLTEPFEHRVSIVDLLMNAGPQSPRYIWGKADE